MGFQPAREETSLPDATSARQPPAVMAPSSSTAAEGTAAGGGSSLCPRQGRLCSASRLLREAAGTALSVVSAMLIDPPRPVARLLDGERHVARAVVARSRALHGGWRDAGRVRCRPPGPGHPPARVAVVRNRRLLERRPAAYRRRAVPAVPGWYRYCCNIWRGRPHIRLNREAGRKGHRTVDRSWWLSLPSVCVRSLSPGHRVLRRPPQ